MTVKTRVLAAWTAIAVLLLASVPARAEDIADKLAERADFSILSLALKQSGLVDALKSKGPFTLFAPTDEAFGKLPGGMVETLLEPKNKTMLRDILKYHVLPAKTLMAARIVEVGNFDINTLEGSRAEINTKNGPSIENAKIIQADIVADNGVIHVIDAVMLPPKVKSRIGRGG